MNDTGNALFAISGQHNPGMLSVDQRNRVYVYKYFFRNTGGGAERAQSSWSHFELTGADEILQVLCIQEVLYLLVRYGDEIYLESMEVSDRQGDENAEGPYELLLDRFVTNDPDRTPADLLITVGDYDPQTNTTTFTLPYTVAAETELWTTWQMFTPGSTGPVLLGSTMGATRSPQGVIRPTWWWQQVSRICSAIASPSSRWCARSAEAKQPLMRCGRRSVTQRFDITKPASSRSERCLSTAAEGLYTYDGTVSAVRNAAIGAPPPGAVNPDTPRYFEGVFTVPIYGQGDRIYVELLNDRPIPCKFSTCEWTGLLSGRARAVS